GFDRFRFHLQLDTQLPQARQEWPKSGTGLLGSSLDFRKRFFELSAMTCRQAPYLGVFYRGDALFPTAEICVAPRQNRLRTRPHRASLRPAPPVCLCPPRPLAGLWGTAAFFSGRPLPPGVSPGPWSPRPACTPPLA